MFDDFVIVGGLLKLAYAALGVVLVILLSVWLDRRVAKMLSAQDGGFGGAMHLIRSTPLSAGVYYGLRIVALALLVAALMGCSPAAAQTTDRYDGQIRQAVATYWPDYPDWLSWKAQLYQESRLDPAAVSPAGAKGLAQFMPGTWEDMRQQLRLGPAASPHDDIAIQAGAYYMARLRAAWKSRRTAHSRQQLAQASYNAGLGHILRAQSACYGARDWTYIAPCLPGVTGRHAAETITYVDRIAKWRAMLAARL